MPETILEAPTSAFFGIDPGTPAPLVESAPAPVLESAPALETPLVETPVLTAPSAPVGETLAVAPVAITPVVEVPVIPVQAPASVPAPIVEPVNPYADPFIEQLNELVKSGTDLRAYLPQLLADHKATPVEQLAREKLQREFPSATPAQIDIAFKRRYTTDPDQYDADDVTMGQMQLHADGETERTARLTEQGKLAIPTPAAAVDRSAEEVVARQQWQARATPVVQALTSLSIAVEGLATPLAVPVANRAFAGQTLAPETVFARWQDANGQPDMAAMARDLAYLDNRAAIETALLNEGRRTVLAVGTNATPTGGEPATTLPGGSAKSEQEQMFEGLRAARMARGLL